MSKRSIVIAFPIKNRLGDIQRCAEMLDKLHGQQAEVFWREECRALADSLIAIGYDDGAMRHEVMEFQNAVQSHLWTASTEAELAVGERL